MSSAISRLLRFSVSLVVLASACGCAVGPDFHRPAAPAVSGYTPEPLPDKTASADVPGGVEQTFAQGADISGQWWTLFQSPALNQLVQDSLKNNADLQAAQAALRAARETYYAQRGALLPSVEASYNINEQQASSTPAPPLSSSVNLFTLQTAQLAISYVPDVFGGIRRQTETAAAQADAQRFETEATYLTLTSNVVAGAIQEASLRNQLAAAEKIVGLERELLDLTRRQMAVGQASGGDVAAQEAALAQAEQTLPALQKQLAQQRDLIAALTGRFPSEAPSDDLDLDSLTLPTDLPVSLPSSLVEQRPDVRVAEANLHAASAQVGVAIANRLPSFMLTAGAGGASTSLATLFSQGNGFWSLSAGVTQPIFEGGALLHRQKAAEAALDQAKAQYRSTVIDAFQNVADTLQALQVDAAALQAADRGERSAAKSLAIARKQLEVGDASQLAVLNAEQVYQQALIARAQAQSNRYADTAALFQALGGGWWNRTDT
jgi:NodT family efflux transporter outer membrane factor (OMF) lipoprotein